jgi:hypothetical protein
VLRRPVWKRLVEYTPPNLEPVCHCEGFDPSPAARARADEIVAAYDEWWPKTHRRTANSIEPRYPRGFSRVEKQHKRLEALLSRLEAKINKTRARTIVGVLAKAKVASLTASDHDGDHDPVVWSVLQDTLALGDSLGWPGCNVNANVFPPRGRA